MFFFCGREIKENSKTNKARRGNDGNILKIQGLIFIENLTILLSGVFYAIFYDWRRCFAYISLHSPLHRKPGHDELGQLTK